MIAVAIATGIATKKKDMQMKNGLFITFEGGDACGKSTQVKLFKEYVATRKDKEHFVFVREPGGTSLGEKIRELLLCYEEDSPVPKAELLLFLASRAQLFEKTILPALNQGKIVVADRFYDSTIAYQGFARKIFEADEILKLNEMILGKYKPDLTFYLKIKPEIAFERKNLNSLNFDRMEKEALDFHQKVYEGYQFISKKEKERFVVLDATKSIDEIHNEIVSSVENLIKNNTKKCKT